MLWLVTQRSRNKGWGFPKGLIGDIVENEAKEDAALREVQEEGGVTTHIVNDEPVKVTYTYKDHNGVLVDKTVFYFLMEYESGNPDDHDWEVSEAKFMPEKEVQEILTYKADKEAFEKMRTLL